MKPTIGRIVLYRSRTGDYTVPAIVTATVETLNAKGVELGHVPALSSPDHVHLTVFTPGRPGMRRGAGDFLVESEHGRSENVAGCYQEWDIPFDGGEAPPAPAGREQTPGTWDWPKVTLEPPKGALEDMLGRDAAREYREERRANERAAEFDPATPREGYVPPEQLS